MNLCALKLKILFGFLFLLGLGIFWANPVRAMTDTLSILQNSGGQDKGPFSNFTQTFKAINNTVSKFAVSCKYGSVCLYEPPDNDIYICEVANASSTTCLDSPVKSTGGTYQYADWHSTNGGDGYYTTIGNFYKIYGGVQGVIDYSNTNPYSDGRMDSNDSNDMYFEIYYNSDYTQKIIYTGIGTERSNENGDFFIPYYWDVCNEYQDISEATIWAYFDDTTSGMPITLIDPNLVGPQLCRGSGIYQTNQNYSSELNSSGTVKIILELFINETIEYSETSSFYYSLYTNPDNYVYGSAMGFDSGFTQLIDTSVGTSTEIQAIYDFTGLSDWASSSVCIYNIIAGVDTDYCFTPTEESGFGRVYLPYSLSNEFDLYFRWHANFDTSSDLWDENVFHIVWQVFSNLPPDNNYLSCMPPIFNLSGTCASSSPSFYEMDFWICGIKKAGIGLGNTLFSPDCGSFTSIKNNFSSFKNAFPFSIFYTFMDSVNEAIDTAATTTDQSLGVPFIRKTATGTEYYVQSVVSSSTFQTLISPGLYNTIRTVEAGLYFLLAAIGIYFIIWKK